MCVSPVVRNNDIFVVNVFVGISSSGLFEKLLKCSHSYILSQVNVLSVTVESPACHICCSSRQEALFSLVDC